MERQRHNPEPSDTGRKGFREPDEAPDDRPVIVRAPFWASESERLTYEHAVESWPKKPDEGGGSYIVRIAEKVRGRIAAVVKGFPEADRLSPVEYHRRQRELDRQKAIMGESKER